MTVHNPSRPSWACQGCSAPWPCGTRRLQLLAEFDDARQSLSIYLVTQLLDACRDQPHVPAGEMYTRFLGWIHQLVPHDGSRPR